MADSLTHDNDMVDETTYLPTPPPTQQPATDPTTGPAPEPATDPTTGPAPEPKSQPTAQPTTEPATGPTPEPATEPTLEPVTETVGMKRPRRAAAVDAIERMQEVLQWEHCNESSHMFKRVAQQINDEFDRVSKGERSYLKQSSTASTGDGGAAAPDPPSDDERNETKDNDEVEADSVDGSSESEGSFVVSDNHLSQGETEDEHTGSDGDKSSLTCTDNSDEEGVTGLVDDTASVASANESMPPTQPIAEYLAERGVEAVVDQGVEQAPADQEPEVLESGFEDSVWLSQTESAFEGGQAEPPVFGGSGWST